MLDPTNEVCARLLSTADDLMNRVEHLIEVVRECERADRQPARGIAFYIDSVREGHQAVGAWIEAAQLFLTEPVADDEPAAAEADEPGEVRT